MKKWIFLVLISLLFSCEKSHDLGDLLGTNADIVGSWVEQGYEDDVSVLLRANDLDDEKYGFTIEEDGRFVERKNAGWCGTPPISYANFDGQWEAVSDSLLDITVGYWGGTMSYQIRIVSLDMDELRIRYLYGDGREDAR